MVQQYTSNDTRHLADHAMSTNYGALNRRSFADLCRTSDHRIRRDLRFRINKSPIFWICWQTVSRPQQELYHDQYSSESRSRMMRTCLFASKRVAILFTLPANPVSCAMIPILKLANGSSHSSGSAGDDVTENGTGFSEGELEPLDDRSCVRIEPPNRVECRSAKTCASLVVIDLSTDREWSVYTPNNKRDGQPRPYFSRFVLWY